MSRPRWKGRKPPLLKIETALWMWAHGEDPERFFHADLARDGRLHRETREVMRKIKTAYPELELSGPNRLGIEYLMWKLSESPDRRRPFPEIAAEIAGQLAPDLVRLRQGVTESEASELDCRINTLWRAAA